MAENKKLIDLEGLSVFKDQLNITTQKKLVAGDGITIDAETNTISTNIGLSTDNTFVELD